MARSEVFFRNRALLVPGAPEFFDIGEVLQASGGLFGEDEVGFTEVVDGEIVFHGSHFVFPSRN